MVKIGDPRNDRSGITLRMMRAEKASKYIKKKVNNNESNYCTFNEEHLGLHKIDKDFYEEFKECTEDIKKELIFLWEEVFDLNQRLDYYEDKKMLEKLKKYNDHDNCTDNDNVELKLDEIVTPEPPPFEEDTTAKKRTYVFGP